MEPHLPVRNVSAFLLEGFVDLGQSGLNVNFSGYKRSYKLKPEETGLTILICFKWQFFGTT